MEFKDTRSKEKRVKMRQHRKGPSVPSQAPLPQRVRHSRNESSASYEFDSSPAVIDVADSSDEHITICPTTRLILPKSRRNLDELELNDKHMEEFPQLNAGDFKIMSQMPTSVGGHFHFSSEKNWDTDEPLVLNTEAREYFTMNSKLLNVGLRSIPFYKRMDYAPSMFNRQQLRAMDKSAEAAETEYQKVLKEHDSNPKVLIYSGKKEGSAKAKTNAREENKKDNDEELEELLSMSESKSMSKLSLHEEKDKSVATQDEKMQQKTTGGESEKASESKEDIQQWLDNVLDE